MVDANALQPLLDALTTRAALVGPDGTVLATNKAWRRASGHPLAGPALGPGTDYLTVLNTAGGPMRTEGLRLAAALARVLEDGSEAISHTYRYGPVSHVQWSRTSLCPIEGRPRQVAVLHEDITEQVHTQAALKRSQARLRTILTGAPIVLFSLDRSGVFTVVEGMGGAGTGFVTEDLVGSSVYAAYRHMPDLLEVINSALRGRTGVITQTVGHLAFEIRCSPIIRRERVDGAVGVATDVTERLRAQRMKDEFVSIVSHELRTPLTSIRGSLGLIEGGVAGELPAKARNLVHIARTNTDRLVRLINDILDLDKMEAGQVTLQRAPVETGAMLDEVIGQMHGYAQQASVRVELVDRDPQCPPVHGDRDRLVQVLTNLISNAIKFSPEGGRVEVRAAASQGRVRFSVTDHGPGIAQVDIPRLFQKFHQLDASDTRARGGSGLGLVIAKSLVEAHHGRIGVDSEVDEGSTFFFEIPVAHVSNEEAPGPRQSHSPAVAIDPESIVAPQVRGPLSLLSELEAHLRDAAESDDLDALGDAQATARILGATLPPDVPAELQAMVEQLARALDEALQRSAPPTAAVWAHLRRELERIRERLAD